MGGVGSAADAEKVCVAFAERLGGGAVDIPCHHTSRTNLRDGVIAVICGEAGDAWRAAAVGNAWFEASLRSAKIEPRAGVAERDLRRIVTESSA